jgi:hypothetical protein
MSLCSGLHSRQRLPPCPSISTALSQAHPVQEEDPLCISTHLAAS